MKKPTAVILALLFLTSCSTWSVKEPAGFAVIREEKNIFSAVSPEGFIYRIRTEANYPRQDADFWQKALQAQLSKEGYILLEEPLSLEIDGSGGFVLIWGVPYKNTTYVYLTAVIPRDKVLYLAEAAGPYSLFSGYREPILESLSGIRFN